MSGANDRDLTFVPRMHRIEWRNDAEGQWGHWALYRQDPHAVPPLDIPDPDTTPLPRHTRLLSRLRSTLEDE